MGKILTAFVIGLCAFAWRVYESMDMGRTVYNHRPGVCRQVHGPVKGSEDIELIRSDGIAFITSGILYLQPRRADVEGKMFLYDLNQKLGASKLVANELPIKGDSFDKDNFHPHGLTHWVINGIIRLYVINHDDKFKHSIEVFDYEPTERALMHKKSIAHPTFIRPNNLVAVGPDQFIFTNDGMAQTEVWNFLEILSGCKGGSVFFWDGENSHVLVPSMGGPNGIAFDPAANKLFVVEINYKRMNVYDLAKDKKSATLLTSTPLHSACDNLFLDTDGSILTGCHPRLIEAAKSLGDCDGDSTSPSQVLKIKYNEDYTVATVSEPYANDGKEISGSSVAMLFSNQMLIGSVCKGLLHCEIADLNSL